MKLAKEQVEKIVGCMLERLKDKGLIILKAEEAKVFDKMVEVFVADLKAEDLLDREVEAILESHTRELDAHRADHRKMFNMIKGKLARERGIVI
ncbi:MAG: DUF507 family protein [Deltaproteobacteria bacterium]|nr:DUF507 family protein [Deltaproteobacteria bacterium]